MGVQLHPPLLRAAHEAQPALAVVHAAAPWTHIALHPLAVHAVPIAGLTPLHSFGKRAQAHTLTSRSHAHPTVETRPPSAHDAHSTRRLDPGHIVAASRLHRIRPAAVAGLFYPADAGELTARIDSLLDEPHAGPAVGDWGKLRALVVPHAGYVYSGPIAASAYRLLVRAGQVSRIVLLGPSHYEGFRGLALPTAAAFATPLGHLELDGTALRMLRGLPGILIRDSAHAPEHSLEVQLPFLRRLAGGAPIVPILTGAASPAEVDTVIEALWDERTVMLVSSDLSHFHAYDAARSLDAHTAQAFIEAREDLSSGQACGCVALNGLARAARKRKLTPRLLDLRNSGDTAGDRRRVVGYGAFALHAA